MDRRYVVGFKQEEVAAGILSRISDILTEEFFATSQAALDLKRSKPSWNPRREWAKIEFLDPLQESGEGSYKGYFTILFLNDVAKKLLESKEINLKVLDEVDSVPKSTGNFVSMPRYLV